MIKKNFTLNYDIKIGDFCIKKVDQIVKQCSYIKIALEKYVGKLYFFRISYSYYFNFFFVS